MDEPQGPIPLEPLESDLPVRPQSPLPAGRQRRLSVVELAARRGLGPLSPAGGRVWHGDARPCVSCGQLVRRALKTCTECGQDLSDPMLEKMREHSGPWYVHEHVRPFPGVSLDRLIRQIRRGVLTRTTVVRGPTTYHQWRFAAETPGLSKYLGCCWKCQAAVQPADSVCGACGADLDGGFKLDGTPPPAAATATGESAEIQQLTTALHAVPRTQRARAEAAPVKVAGLPIAWFVGLLFVVTLALLIGLVQLRAGTTASTRAVSKDVTKIPPVAAPVAEPAPSTPEAGSVDGEPAPQEQTQNE